MEGPAAVVTECVIHGQLIEYSHHYWPGSRAAGKEEEEVATLIMSEATSAC